MILVGLCCSLCQSWIDLEMHLASYFSYSQKSRRLNLWQGMAMMSSNPSLVDCNQEANDVTYLWDDFTHHPLEESFVFIYQRTHEINAMLVCIETFVGHSKIILYCIKVSFFNSYWIQRIKLYIKNLPRALLVSMMILSFLFGKRQ